MFPDNRERQFSQSESLFGFAILPRGYEKIMTRGSKSSKKGLEEQGVLRS